MSRVYLGMQLDQAHEVAIEKPCTRISPVSPRCASTSAAKSTSPRPSSTRTPSPSSRPTATPGSPSLSWNTCAVSIWRLLERPDGCRRSARPLARSNVRRPASGPRGRHRPPRPQAGQLHGRLPRHAARAGQADGLRPGQAVVDALHLARGTGQRAPSNGVRHARVHLAGAGPRQRGRSPQRRLQPGRHSLRDAGRTPTVRGDECRRTPDGPPRRGAADAGRSRRRWRQPGRRGGDARLPGQVPRGEATNRRGTGPALRGRPGPQDLHEGRRTRSDQRAASESVDPRQRHGAICKSGCVRRRRRRPSATPSSAT